MKTGTLIAILFCSFISFAHLLRLVFGVGVTVADTVIPMWPSVVAVIGPAIIAWLLWREAKSET